MDIVLLHTSLADFMAPGLAFLEDFDGDVVGEILFTVQFQRFFWLTV